MASRRKQRLGDLDRAILCYYDEKDTLTEVKVELLVPRGDLIVLLRCPDHESFRLPRSQDFSALHARRSPGSCC
jgi:hypothetical protein